MIAPNATVTCTGRLLERSVKQGMNGVPYIPFPTSITYADDVAYVSPCRAVELLVLLLQVFQAKAVSLGLEVNWQKTMVQAWAPREMDLPVSYLYVSTMSNASKNLSTLIGP